MSTIDYEALTVLEIMVMRELRNKAEDFPEDIRPPIPSSEQIASVLDGAGGGLDNAIGYMWDAIRDFVYDNFPQFNIDVEYAEDYEQWPGNQPVKDDRAPDEIYGTPEHEAWLIEMERQEG